MLNVSSPLSICKVLNWFVLIGTSLTMLLSCINMKLMVMITTMMLVLTLIMIIIMLLMMNDDDYAAHPGDYDDDDDYAKSTLAICGDCSCTPSDATLAPKD